MPVSGETSGSGGGPEKRYVNLPEFPTRLWSCGKPLWKNLWRMWKTLIFPQRFFLPACFRPCAENPPPAVMVLPKVHGFPPALQNATRGRKPKKIGLFPADSTRQSVSQGPIRNIFVDSSKIFSVSFSPSREILGTRNQQEDTLCREK